MIQSVERAFRILQTVAACDSWMGVREVARAVELKVPTTQNILKTLTACGYLEFSPRFRAYRLGLAPLLLVERSSPIARLADFVYSDLKRFFDLFGETTICCTMLGGRVVIVQTFTSSEPLAVIHSNRVVVHPHCLASGRLLLAYASEELVTNYIRTTPFESLGVNLPASGEELLQELAVIRKKRYAEVLNAANQGVGALAVPVFGPGGDVVLCLACSAPLARFNAERRKAIRAACEESARSISEKLGTAMMCQK